MVKVSKQKVEIYSNKDFCIELADNLEDIQRVAWIRNRRIYIEHIATVVINNAEHFAEHFSPKQVQVILEALVAKHGIGEIIGGGGENCTHWF